MKCPICNSKRVNLFHDTVWRLKDGKVYRCVNCDIVFLFPRLSSSQEKQLYGNYNKHIKDRGLLLKQEINSLHKYSQVTAKERYGFIKQYFSKVSSVLEIGSSTGAFLEILTKNKQCKTLFGVEPCHDNRKYSLQFANSAYADLEDIPKSEKFEMLSMFHVFEHIKKPIDFLSSCRYLLKKKGKILIEVPFIGDPLISLYDCKKFKDFYFQSIHPYTYSLEALRYVFSKAGFVEKGIIYYQRYGLDNHLTWLAKGVPGGDKFLSELFVNEGSYKKKLEKIGKTDTLFYIVEKK